MMYLLVVLYLALVLLRPQDYPEWIERLSGPLLPAVLVLAACFWLPRRGKSFAEPQYPLLLLFLGAMMLSRAANGWFGGALLQWSAFAPVLLAFVLTANAVDSRARARVLMGVFVLCAAVLALHGVDQARDGVGWTGVGLSQSTRIQYVGIFSDPNDLGMLFVMCVPMAMHLAAGGGASRRLFWTAAAGLLLYGIYLTNSRGTMLALVAMLGVYVWFRWGLFRAMAMGAVAFAVLRMVPSRMQDLSVGESSAFGRVEAWYDGLMMFLGSPLWGVGAGSYVDNQGAMTAHNSFVLVLTETGLIGFTLWLAFVGYCFRMMLEVVAHREAPVAADGPTGEWDEGTWSGEADEVDGEWDRDRRTALALLLALTGCFCAAFFLSRSYVVLLYLLAALVVGFYASMRGHYPALRGFALRHDLVRWAALAVALVVGLYLAVKLMLGIA